MYDRNNYCYDLVCLMKKVTECRSYFDIMIHIVSKCFLDGTGYTPEDINNVCDDYNFRFGEIQSIIVELLKCSDKLEVNEFE